jgi:hypothetical protein
MVLDTLLRGMGIPVGDRTASANAKTAKEVRPVLSRPQLIGRIVAEARAAGLDTDESIGESYISLWERARSDADGRSRPKGRRIETLLTHDEEHNGLHDAMEILTPDNTRPEPGSVHDELDRYVFGVDQAGRARRSVMHTWDSFDHCAVVVTVVPA